MNRSCIRPFWWALQFSEGESSIPLDVTIKDCTFHHNGWISRHGTKGDIGIRPLGRRGNLMGMIVIESNQFEGSEIGVEIDGAQKGVLRSNTFKNIGMMSKQKEYNKTVVADKKNKSLWECCFQQIARA